MCLEEQRLAAVSQQHPQSLSHYLAVMHDAVCLCYCQDATLCTQQLPFTHSRAYRLQLLGN